MKVLPLTVAVSLFPLSRPPPKVAELPVKVLPLTVAVPPSSLARPPPDLLAELLVKVLPLTVAVPTLSRPPPSLLAELLVKVLPLTVAVPTLTRPPPSKLAELLVKELPLTVAVPWLSRPPPSKLAELLVKELPLTVAVPSLKRPPPPKLAELLVKELPLTVAVPSLTRPPPKVAELLVKEPPLTVAVPPLSLARPPPKAGGVAGENAVADRQRPGVVQAAAAAVAGIASRDRQAGDVHGLARIDRKDAEGGGSGGIPLHGRGARSETCYGDVPAQVRQDAFQGDRAGCHDVDDITVTGSSLIGRRDCLPQSATSESASELTVKVTTEGTERSSSCSRGRHRKVWWRALRGGRAGTRDDRSMRKTAGRELMERNMGSSSNGWCSVSIRSCRRSPERS